MNVQYLSQLFIKKEGERFSDYLNRMRMEKARRLILTYRSDNIKDIASQVGFESNPRYFGQVFKRYYGILPSELIVQPHNRAVSYTHLFHVMGDHWRYGGSDFCHR